MVLTPSGRRALFSENEGGMKERGVEDRQSQEDSLLFFSFLFFICSMPFILNEVISALPSHPPEFWRSRSTRA